MDFTKMWEWKVQKPQQWLTRSPKKKNQNAISWWAALIDWLPISTRTSDSFLIRMPVPRTQPWGIASNPFSVDIRNFQMSVTLHWIVAAAAIDAWNFVSPLLVPINMVSENAEDEFKPIIDLQIPSTHWTDTWWIMSTIINKPIGR